MKKALALLLVVSVLSSCQTIVYTGTFVPVSQVELSESNFTVLGSFAGSARQKTSSASKDKVGIVAQAKSELLANASAAGVKLEGSRMLVNVTVDFVQGETFVTATVTGEIIEFK